MTQANLKFQRQSRSERRVIGSQRGCVTLKGPKIRLRAEVTLLAGGPPSAHSSVKTAAFAASASASSTVFPCNEELTRCNASFARASA